LHLLGAPQAFLAVARPALEIAFWQSDSDTLNPYWRLDIDKSLQKIR